MSLPDLIESCCPLGAELVRATNIVYQTENFFVVPSLGQLGIEGYVLLCSKEHYAGVGSIPEDHESELERSLTLLRAIITDVYHSPVLIFEHGPRNGCAKGGGCFDHAHLHLLPTDADIVPFLTKIFPIEKMTGIEQLR